MAKWRILTRNGERVVEAEAATVQSGCLLLGDLVSRGGRMELEATSYYARGYWLQFVKIEEVPAE